MKRLHKTILSLSQLEARLAPAITSTLTWQGDIDDNWGSGTSGTTTNWSSTPSANKLPSNGAILVFPAAPAGNTVNNNDIAGLNLKSLSFTGDGYSISGQAITLSGGLTANYSATGNNFFKPSITLAANQTFAFSGNNSADFIFNSIDLGGKTLTVDNGFNILIGQNATVLSGAGTLVKAGAGTLTLLADNAFTGPVQVNAGRLKVASTGGLGASNAGNGTIVANGATVQLDTSIDGTIAEDFTLGGTGQFNGGAIQLLGGPDFPDGSKPTLTGALRLSGDATIDATALFGERLTLAGAVGAENDALAILTVDSAFMEAFGFANTATFTVELAGTTPGAGGHDQLRVTGALALGGATLNVVPSFTPNIGDQFTIVENNGGNQNIGTFAGKNEGDVFEAGGIHFKITYQGGTNNRSVVLTVDGFVDAPLDVALSTDGKTASFTDRDGDLVTVKTTKGPFQQSDFRAIEAGVGGQLQLINLTSHPDDFTGANLTITAKPGPLGGNGFVNVGSVNATGIDLGAVKIAGDLGRLNVGTVGGDAKVPALKSLDVHSLGLLGTSTQSAGADVGCVFQGGLSKLTVKSDVRLTVFVFGAGDGKIGSATVGGSLTTKTEGGPVTIAATAGIGSLKIGGDIRSTVGAFVKVATDGLLGALSVGGSIVGADASSLVQILASGQLAASPNGINLAIKSVNVRGSVEFANIAAGSSELQNPDATIGSIAVGGDWIASCATAGTSAGADSMFGNDNDSKASGNDSSTIFSTIGSFTVKGQAFGTATSNTDMFGIVAERIGKAKVGGRTFAFKADTATVQNREAFFAAPTLDGEGTEIPAFDFTIRELGSTTPTPAFGGPNLVLSADTRTATFIDVDGDRVTVNSSSGPLTIVIAPTGSGGARLQLIKVSPAPNGTPVNLSITARPGPDGGNGFVNVGKIDALNVDLGTVIIAGELEHMVAGDTDPAKPGIGILTVQSLGELAGTSGNADVISSGHTIGKINVKTDVREVDVKTNLGNLGAIRVGGSVTGDVFIASVGDIGAIKIGGSWRGEDTIIASGRIGTIDIGGDLIGRGNGNVTIEALAKGAGPATGLDLAIKSLTVKGNIDGTRIVLGNGTNADASMGTISVGRAWLASSVEAGVKAGNDGLFGTADDETTTGANLIDVANRFSTISSITIKGQALGSTTPGDHFGILAERILKAKIGARTFNFNTGERDAVDAFAIAPTGPGGGGLAFDFFIREITV